MRAGPRPTPRRLMAACAGGVLALCASLYAAPAQAQTTFISNTGQATAGGTTFSAATPLAQSFRTGDHSAGYTLHSVVVNFGPFSNNITTLTAEVRTNTAQNTPSSTVVAEFTEPSPVSDTSSSVEVEIPVVGDVTLSSNTTYHLVLSHTQTMNTTSLRKAARNSLDSGTASGWSFPDGGQRNPDGGGWEYAEPATRANFQMQVRGTAIAPPDTTPPTLDTAVVNGDTLTLTYDEALDTASVPDKSAFTLGGTSETVSTVAVSGMAVTLTLSAAVTSGDTVTVSYAVPANPVQDTAGNDAAALSTQAVTNNTPPMLVRTGNSRPTVAGSRAEADVR